MPALSASSTFAQPFDLPLPRPEEASIRRLFKEALDARTPQLLVIILWPFGPIRFVYELGETLPKIDRGAIGDPFAVSGTLPKGAVGRLRRPLDRQRRFPIAVEERRFGQATG